MKKPLELIGPIECRQRIDLALMGGAETKETLRRVNAGGQFQLGGKVT